MRAESMGPVELAFVGQHCVDAGKTDALKFLVGDCVAAFVGASAQYADITFAFFIHLRLSESNFSSLGPRYFFRLPRVPCLPG